MKAIIVPGVTDLNKGDQALVWEAHRLIKDTNLYDKVYILSSGSTEEEKIRLCQQSLDKGYEMIDNILRHPRKGKHRNEEYIKESSVEMIRQIKNAVFDFLCTAFLLLICNKLVLVKKIFSIKIYQTVKQFKEADAVFVKGGGFVHAYGEKTAPYLMWYFLFYVRLAKRLNKMVIFLPNSYGPFDGFTVKNQVRKVFSQLDLVYARECVSAESLGNLLNKKIVEEMDLGFFLQKGEEKKAIEMLAKYNLSDSDRIIGITVRPWRFPGSQNSKELYLQYIKSVTDLVHHIVGKGYKVALCNQSLGPNSHEDDRNAIQDLLKGIKHSSVVWINENLTCEELKALYSNFYFFVGTRFHSIIFSLTSLIPSIAIGYGGNKARGIMSDFNLDEFVIQIDDVESDLLISTFDNAIGRYNEIKHKLSRSMVSVLESRNRLIKDIQSLYK